MRRALYSLLTSLALLLGTAPAVYAKDSRVIDVASVSWSGAKLKYPISDVERAVKEDVGVRWRNYTKIEASKSEREISFEIGETLTQAISLTKPMDCEGRDASTFMNSVRAEAYKRLGITDWKERYLVIVAPSAGCIWTGRALIGDRKTKGGVMVLHDSSSAFVIVHELGHALGLGHTNFLSCKSNASDGPWGNDCSAVEYGGAIDVMGNVDIDLPLSAYNQWRIGYLENSEIKQSWLSEKIELNAVDLAGGNRAIFLRDGKATYWIEYRRAREGSPYRPGLVIYRTDPPPGSAIISPNPEDINDGAITSGSMTDLWMLNWDDYKYAFSKASGSMALPNGKTATVFSGNISITASATDSPNRVIVEVIRKADNTPPPKPRLTNPNLWRFADAPLIEEPYEDRETVIENFEIDMLGEVKPLRVSAPEFLNPTYLNPINPEKKVYLKDLPEGDYQFRIRAIDAWGNKSEWSDYARAYIDRGPPQVSADFTLGTITPERITLNWIGARDQGVGLCNTVIHNQEGFVLARSDSRIAPELALRFSSSTNAKAQVFDCVGNGVTGDVKINSKFIPVAKMKRSGKWVEAPASYGPSALKCVGRCAAFASVDGTTSLLVGEGRAEVFLSGKSAFKVNESAKSLRPTQALKVTGAKRVVRITGKDFILGGIASMDLLIGEFKPLARKATFPDPSLEEEAQKRMLTLGFNSSDFTQDWTVLPMARGTTLLDPTLDLCGFKYESESGREIRRQVAITKVGSPYSFLSSESVRYKDVAAAKMALSELKKNYATCVAKSVGQEDGVLSPYLFQSLPKSDARLVDEGDRLIVLTIFGSGESARQLLAFYQYSGQFFTGFYVVTGTDNRLDEGEILRWFDVASVLAERLVTQAQSVKN